MWSVSAARTVDGQGQASREAREYAGIEPAQLARTTVEPSNLTLLGLVRHMAEVERWWFRRSFAGEAVGNVFTGPSDGLAGERRFCAAPGCPVRSAAERTGGVRTMVWEGAPSVDSAAKGAGQAVRRRSRPRRGCLPPSGPGPGCRVPASPPRSGLRPR
ncbi:DUF664 domain-containing protein [Streptomyces sp. NPDC059070]|uniref:mycothiol transferase n=1 Tax=Streptomyces sp. NPDC059070 TaxID=3346713 RepID=UPI0036ADFF40